MTFKTNLQDDASNVFCNATEFAEAITYYPDGDTGDPRPLSGVVERGEVEAVDLTGSRILLRGMAISIPNHTDTTKGLTAIVRGKDLVDVPVEEGGPAVRHRVVRLLEADPGIFRVEAVK